MKKTIVTLVVGLLISVATMAQSKTEARAEKIANKDLQKVTAVVSLDKAEQEKYLAIKKDYLINHFDAATTYKESDPVKFKEKVKENGKKLNDGLVEAFGRARAVELLKASRAK